LAPDSVWEIVFLMAILKIPVVYLCVVVYYAIKAEPKPGAEPGGPQRRSRPRRLHPRGGPSRTYSRTPRPAHARAEVGRR